MAPVSRLGLVDSLGFQSLEALWVVPAETRCEYVLVRSIATSLSLTSLSLTVSTGATHIPAKCIGPVLEDTVLNTQVIPEFGVEFLRADCV